MGVAHDFSFSNHGHILVLWDAQLVEDEQLINCRIHGKILEQQVLTIFVYGLHNIVRRRSLWYSLKELGESINEPWMIIGDFNALLSVPNKSDGLLITNYKLQDFQGLVHSCNLVEF